MSVTWAAARHPGGQSTVLAAVQRRFLFVKIGVILLTGLLILRLWQLQIRDGSHYRTLSQDNRTRSILIHPVRGLIYDRHGILLANSVPSFNLYVQLDDVPDRDALLRKLAELLSLDEQALRKTIRDEGRNMLVRLKQGLSLKEAAIVESHRLDLPGVEIHPEAQRNNPQGAYAAHVIGYVGAISEEQLAREEFQGLPRHSIIGQSGVERVYDRTLRGRAGSKLIEVNALGHEKRLLSVEKPHAGSDMYLTIDFRLQKLAEDVLGDHVGAIVALDPRTGATLALASRPSFDPNALSRGLSAEGWNAMRQNTRHPLMNRAIQGQYPPASTFKIILAAAALETGIIDQTRTLPCAGAFRFGKRDYRDWKAGGHGAVNLPAALAQSCDVYFYRVGHLAGIETIAAAATQFGLGQLTGVDLPGEAAGIVPSPEWKRRARGEPWYPGETISVSIGQSYVMVTPLQMAKVIATIGNQGIARTPHVVRGIRERASGKIEERMPSDPPSPALHPDHLQGIQAALAKAVTDGTARRARSSTVAIAGKTGTAQVVALSATDGEDVPSKFRDHAWFVAYAPFERPRIALAVLVEHSGHGGSMAVPLAKRLIEAYMSYESDGEPRAPSPAPGFDQGALPHEGNRGNPLHG
ncbi:MAG: penicillin-binding protein 2 [Nitrospira sp.]|nr:penicillin-binding protein 2 [Nitrospira sp.]